MLTLKKILPLFGALTALAGFSLSAQAQVIGSYDNFDTFNNTGEEAEGFEIDVEDVGPSDITRIFPDNFPAGQPFIRYATPDKAQLTSVTFPDGHSGVRIVYAAAYVGGQWAAQWGASTMPGTSTPIGNGTPYVASPTLTLGESCWTLGLGAAYPASGCDHFGISLAGGVVPGKITYHWLIPDPNTPGQLIQYGSLAAIPPSPVLAVNPQLPGQVVHAVAEAPENPEPQWGDATWVKTTTLFGNAEADLNQLQKIYIKNAKTKKKVTWALLQQPPAGQAGEKMEVEDDAIPANAKNVTKQYEYFSFGGPKNAPSAAYDPETHEALCEIYKSAADAIAGNNPIATDCLKPRTGNYWVLNPVTGTTATFVKGGNLGAYLGAHINALNPK